MLDEIRIADCRIASGLPTGIDQRCQCRRVRERIIGVDKNDAAPGTYLQTLVHRKVDAVVRFGDEMGYALLVATHYVDRAIGRCPIDDDVLERPVTLRQNTLDGRRDFGRGISRYADDGDQWIHRLNVTPLAAKMRQRHELDGSLHPCPGAEMNGSHGPSASGLG